MAITRACGRRVLGVGFELNPLLEVDEVELKLVGAVDQRRVGDQGMQKGRFTGTGAASGENVLGCALAELEALELGGARAAERDLEDRPSVALPVPIGLRER